MNNKIILILVTITGYNFSILSKEEVKVFTLAPETKTTPIATKPAVSKPAPKPVTPAPVQKTETPPIETKPETAQKEEIPVEMPVEEIKPVEIPVEETKPVEEIKPVEETTEQAKPESINTLEYQLSWYQKELDNYNAALSETNDLQKKVLDNLIATKRQQIDTIQQKIDEEKRKKSDILKLQDEIDGYKKEISEHEAKLNEATEQERPALQGLITLKQGLIDTREEQIKEIEKKQILQKPVSYLETIKQQLEKELEQHKKDLETVEAAKKGSLENTIAAKEQLLKEINTNLEKRKNEQAQASGAVGNWQEQKEIIQESISDQNFIKDRVSPALKAVIDENVEMKSEAVKQLDANIQGGQTGQEIQVVEGTPENQLVPTTPTEITESRIQDIASRFGDEPTQATITETKESGTTVSEERIKEIANRVLPEVQGQQATYLSKLGVPSSSPLGQTLTVNNEMASSLLGPVNNLQSQAQSAVTEQTQRAIERINIFKGEARELQHKEECEKRLKASGCYKKSCRMSCKPYTPCKTKKESVKYIKTCDVEKLLKEFGCPVKNNNKKTS